MYCSAIGLSKPYFRAKLARISGVVAFSFINGSPGTACIARKVAVAMNQMVTSPDKMRPNVYFNMGVRAQCGRK